MVVEHLRLHMYAMYIPPVKIEGANIKLYVAKRKVKCRTQHTLSKIVKISKLATTPHLPKTKHSKSVGPTSIFVTYKIFYYLLHGRHQENERQWEQRGEMTRWGDIGYLLCC